MNRRVRIHPGQAAGFTLVEILVVVTILGIAALIVVPQVHGGGSLTIQAAARRIIADVLVAQNEAIARGSATRVVFDPAEETYRLLDENQAPMRLPWMGGDYVVDFKSDGRFSGVVIDSVNFGGDPYVIFDELGAPSTGGTVDISSGSIRYRVTVAPFTGRVTVAPVAGGI